MAVLVIIILRLKAGRCCMRNSNRYKVLSSFHDLLIWKLFLINSNSLLLLPAALDVFAGSKLIAILFQQMKRAGLLVYSCKLINLFIKQSFGFAVMLHVVKAYHEWKELNECRICFKEYLPHDVKWVKEIHPIRSIL